MQISKIIVFLCLHSSEMEFWRHGDIESIRKVVDPAHHNVVNLMQETRLKMKASERLPYLNTSYIIDTRSAITINDFFKALKVKSLNSSHLIVNDELVIDAKAFLQMTKIQKGTLIQETKKLKTIAIENFGKNSLSDEAKLICSEYRLTFEKQRMAGILRILTVFQVQSEGALTFGQIQFGGLEPNDKDRIICVLKESGKKAYNAEYSRVIRKMADRFQVDKVLDFVAVAEYTARRINNKIKSLRSKDPNPADKPQEMEHSDNFEKAVDIFFTNNSGFQEMIYNEFQDLCTECAEHYSKHEFRFKTLMVAANHYDKHVHSLGKKLKLKEPAPRERYMSPDIYFVFARVICSIPEKNPKWTQDGSSVCRQIWHDGIIAVRYDNPYEGTSVIATLHVKKKTFN